MAVVSEPSIWGVIISSGAIGAIVSAIITARVTKANNDKNLSLKYVTQERQKWRNRIKELASEIYVNKMEDDEAKKKFKKTSSELRLHLNPYPLDPDNEILNCVKLIEINPNDYQLREKLIVHVAYMLKHDWQRSKVEAGLKKSPDVERKLPPP